MSICYSSQKTDSVILFEAACRGCIKPHESLEEAHPCRFLHVWLDFLSFFFCLALFLTVSSSF